MPYIPPHLRGGNDGSVTSSSGDSMLNAGGGRGQRSQSDFGGSYRGRDSYGSSRNLSRGSDSGYKERSVASPSLVNRPLDSRPSFNPEPVWKKWEPSSRVQELTETQTIEVRKRLNVDVEMTSEDKPIIPAVESFEDMGLHASIMRDIVFHSFTSPTPIQAQAMPVALSGMDLLGCAETGSGKTAAFSIPMIQHCLGQAPIKHGDGPLALVLAPTRELAQQIEKEVKAFSKSSPGFRTAIIVGGTPMGEQKSELRRGVDIVVATPGRFIDHLHQGNTSLSRVSFMVLDEADRMLDMGFEAQMKEIMANLPKRHQTLLFSATMPVEIETLAQEYLTSPVRVKVGRVSSPTANVTQTLEKVAEKDKVDRLLQILVEEQSAAQANQQPLPLTIVFVERKVSCEEIYEALSAQGLSAAPLHGGRSQGEREGALRDFRGGTVTVLVATDVASRGLDVTGVAHVINLDLPKALEDYVHRIGRTGRAGASGRATSFYTDRDAFIVAQIKKALADVEAGNTMAFATGKAARKKERQEAAAFRENRNAPSDVAMIGMTAVRVDNKYKHMLAATTGSKKGEGMADDAWED